MNAAWPWFIIGTVLVVIDYGKLRKYKPRIFGASAIVVGLGNLGTVMTSLKEWLLFLILSAGTLCLSGYFNKYADTRRRLVGLLLLGLAIPFFIMGRSTPEEDNKDVLVQVTGVGAGIRSMKKRDILTWQAVGGGLLLLAGYKRTVSS